MYFSKRPFLKLRIITCQKPCSNIVPTRYAYFETVIVYFVWKIHNGTEHVNENRTGKIEQKRVRCLKIITTTVSLIQNAKIKFRYLHGRFGSTDFVYVE